jgi:hypothetical protein
MECPSLYPVAWAYIRQQASGIAILQSIVFETNILRLAHISLSGQGLLDQGMKSEAK